MTRTIIARQADFTQVNGVAQYTVPANRVYRLKGLSGLLTADATGTTRRIAVGLWDAANVSIWQGTFIYAQPISSGQYYAAAAATAAINGTNIILLAPEIALESGYKFGFMSLPGYPGGVGDAWTQLCGIFEDVT